MKETETVAPRRYESEAQSEEALKALKALGYLD